MEFRIWKLEFGNDIFMDCLYTCIFHITVGGFGKDANEGLGDFRILDIRGAIFETGEGGGGKLNVRVGKVSAAAGVDDEAVPKLVNGMLFIGGEDDGLGFGTPQTQGAEDGEFGKFVGV